MLYDIGDNFRHDRRRNDKMVGSHKMHTLAMIKREHNVRVLLSVVHTNNDASIRKWNNVWSSATNAHIDAALHQLRNSKQAIQPQSVALARLVDTTAHNCARTIRFVKCGVT